jgi:hypothetical protein
MPRTLLTALILFISFDLSAQNNMNNIPPVTAADFAPVFIQSHLRTRGLQFLKGILCCHYKKAG